MKTNFARVIPSQIRIHKTPIIKSSSPAQLVIGEYILAHFNRGYGVIKMSRKENFRQGDEILTCSEVARALKTSRQSVWKWIATGKIDPNGCFQVGKKGRWRIYKSALDRSLNFSTGGVRSKCLNIF